MITRFSSLENYDNILAGRDLAKLFKPGNVYQVEDIMGQLIIQDLGESAIKGDKSYIGSGFPEIMLDGRYLLTKDEHKHLVNQGR